MVEQLLARVVTLDTSKDEAVAGMECGDMDPVNDAHMTTVGEQLEKWGAMKAEEIAKDEEEKRIEAEAKAAVEAPQKTCLLRRCVAPHSTSQHKHAPRCTLIFV